MLLNPVQINQYDPTTDRKLQDKQVSKINAKGMHFNHGRWCIFSCSGKLERGEIMKLSQFHQVVNLQQNLLMESERKITLSKDILYFDDGKYTAKIGEENHPNYNRADGKCFQCCFESIRFSIYLLVGESVSSNKS